MYTRQDEAMSLQYMHFIMTMFQVADFFFFFFLFFLFCFNTASSLCFKYIYRLYIFHRMPSTFSRLFFFALFFSRDDILVLGWSMAFAAFVGTITGMQNFISIVIFCKKTRLVDNDAPANLLATWANVGFLFYSGKFIVTVNEKL